VPDFVPTPGINQYEMVSGDGARNAKIEPDLIALYRSVRFSAKRLRYNYEPEGRKFESCWAHQPSLILLERELRLASFRSSCQSPVSHVHANGVM
jgi:hypothetical protein